MPSCRAQGVTNISPGITACHLPPANSTEPAEFTVLRDKIAIHRSESQGGLCIFDNGLVSISIIDMGYTIDDAWELGRSQGTNTQRNQANDSLFPIYQAACEKNPINTHRWVGDRAADTDDGIEYVWTYSTINDAMFYGTLVYDTFVKYLGEPPLNEKLRIRLHYKNLSSATGYWDGAYATFGDGFPFQYSSSSLDSIGHEFGHGVLNRIMGVNFFAPTTEGETFSTAFRTLHEAFSDISGVMAWYEYGLLKGESTIESIGASNYWLHGAENRGQNRKLDQIVTENGAIQSILDYDETERNYYLSIGMFTYPFYLLSQQWGMEAAYGLYIDAARNCWTPTMTHTQIAQCLKQRAELLDVEPNDPTIDTTPNNQKANDVVAAFKTVKIKLFDEGVLSHYNVKKSKLRTQFTDDSRSTNQVTKWLWDFGDNTTSDLQNLQHTYVAAGDYKVKLTVGGSLNHKDDFTRTVSVTDQYCYITTGLTPVNDIGSVVINGTNINFDPEISDYRDATPIQLTGANNRTLNLDITGVNNDLVAKATTWTVWLDINDDGFYSSDEIVSEEVIDKDLPYGINISEDLSAFITSADVTAGEPPLEIGRFIRVVGKNRYSSACSSAAGEAFDVRVAW
jgi:vibriolysin